jgi:flavin-dependent dehydrogenase
MTTDFGDFPLTGRGLVADGVPLGIAPRRARLDALLAEAAVAAGAELRDRFAVQDYIRDGDRITGIAGRDLRSGVRTTELASVVVGADGRNSGLARRVQAPATESAPTATCWYFSYYSGVPCPGLELYARPRRLIFAFPTNDDLVGLFVAFPIGDLAAVRADIEGHMLAAVAAIPDLAERVRGGQREERLYGATQLPNVLRKAWGPGWALVGDAGCHKDPYMALGICDALRDAELLAEALTDGLSGRRPTGAALADYERRRDDATCENFRANLAMAQLGPLPERERQLRAALRFDEDATRHFLPRDPGHGRAAVVLQRREQRPHHVRRAGGPGRLNATIRVRELDAEARAAQRPEAPQYSRYPRRTRGTPSASARSRARRRRAPA